MSQNIFTFVIFLFALLRKEVLIGAQIQRGSISCAEDLKSTCPQSTFTTVQEGSNWKCPQYWLKTNFTSERWDVSLKQVNTSNLTAEVTHSGNTTTISLCTVTPKKISTSYWPSGGYCVPSPTNTPCPKNTMTTSTATVTAIGRDFKCLDMNQYPSPMSNCGKGTFDINACCPKNMDSAEEYLSVPMYDIGAFYLLKTNITCPKLYSFTSTEESLLIDHASISPGLGNYFANATNGTLKITFCRYSSVTCPKKALNDEYETWDGTDPCGRTRQVGCKSKYKVQPDNTDSEYMEYCLPGSGNFSSSSFCGAQCPVLPSISNGAAVPDTNASLAEVRVKCNDGYYVEGPGDSTCQRNGTWSTDLSNSSCKYAECQKSDLPTRGATKWSSDDSGTPFAYGHNVTFFCDPNKTGPRSCFYLPGLVKKVAATCQANGVWNNIPRCKTGSNCKVPGNTTTATHSNNSTVERCESLVEYMCNPHRISVMDQMTLTCRSDGTWDADPPNCETVFCDPLAITMTNGEVEYVKRNGTVPGKFLQSDTLQYECDPKYRLQGDQVITCGGDGQWNGTTDAHCVLVVCSMAPKKIPNGHRIDNIQNQTEYHLGDEVQYQCDSNQYELNYTDPISCSNDDNWNPYIPSCNLVSCDAPPTVEHSIPDPGPFPLHSNYTYTCEKGYEVSDNSNLTCEMKDGTRKWRGTAPTCDLVHCDPAPSISHGNYTTEVDPAIPQYPYNTQFSYQCDTGYNASLAYTTNCTETGQWVPPPGCHPVQCRRPDISYLVVNDSRTLFPFNTVILVKCDDSRVYQPPQDLLCKDDGRFVVKSGSGEIISCHEAVHSNETNKWTYLGVGLSMIIVLAVLLIVYGIKKRRDDLKLALRAPFGDEKRASMSPGYISEDNEMTGFSNPTYIADNDPEAFSIDRTSSNAKNRLVLRTESPEEPQQYDTLRGVRVGGGGEGGRGGGGGGVRMGGGEGGRVEERTWPPIVSEPNEGVYNTLNQCTKPETICEGDEEDPYNMPTCRNSDNSATLAKNHYSTVHPAQQLRDIVVDPDYAEVYGEEVYNVPTLNRDRNLDLNEQFSMVEVNDLYSSIEAAQICGTPLETDFDNIIYDNI